MNKDLEIPIADQNPSESDETATQVSLELIRVKEELKRLKEDFEERVEERTAELTKELDERKRAEESLIQREKNFQGAQKMEAIGTLTGGVAHDFNNLLMVILGCAQLVIRQLKPDDPLQLRLTEIETAGKRAAVLTRQLLAFSRRQHLERRAINLNDIVGETIKLLERIIGADVEVSLKYDPDLSTVFADPAQIEQVVMNLSVNARDAMPEGGQLSIETANVKLDEDYCRQYPYVQPGRYVQVKVSDTGTGMDEETQSRIFEPYFTTKELGKGTGLGLSISYGIIKQHDGHLHVYSKSGHGTTFEAFLPVIELAVEAKTQSVQSSVSGGTETILVAEDEDALRNLAKDILESLGYSVLTAKNGEEAVKIFTENRVRIDALLFDVVMPRLNGTKAYEQIRALADKDIPIILMTGYSVETVQSRFVRNNPLIEKLGIIVIQKPYSADDLGRKVRTLGGGAGRDN